jgi:hypothetical protein
LIVMKEWGMQGFRAGRSTQQVVQGTGERTQQVVQQQSRASESVGASGMLGAEGVPAGRSNRPGAVQAGLGLWMHTLSLSVSVSVGCNWRVKTDMQPADLLIERLLGTAGCERLYIRVDRASP